MHLALFRLAQDLRADADSRHLLQNLSAEQLAKKYHQGGLPAPLQQGLARFLLAYGHQSVCELDLGVPRWAEAPTDILAYLSSYLEPEARAQTPDRQLHQADRAARAMIATLSQRVKPGHWLRRWLVRFCLERSHALAGFREMTRFVVGLVLAQARAHLWPVGAALVEAGRLNQAEDIFWLAFPEAHAALAGGGLRSR